MTLMLSAAMFQVIGASTGNTGMRSLEKFGGGEAETHDLRLGRNFFLFVTNVLPRWLSSSYQLLPSFFVLTTWNSEKGGSVNIQCPP